MPDFHSRQWSFQNPFVLVALGATVLAVAILFAVTDAWEQQPWLAFATQTILIVALFIPMDVCLGEDAVDVKIAGIRVRRIPYLDVISFERRSYRPFRDFGGWGLRWGLNRRHVRAYTTTGSSAAVLTLRDGHEIYVGVADEQAFANALRGRISF